MYTIQPKKLMIINILDILKKYTDENHRLSQKDIVDILDKGSKNGLKVVLATKPASAQYAAPEQTPAPAEQTEL